MSKTHVINARQVLYDLAVIMYVVSTGSVVKNSTLCLVSIAASHISLLIDKFLSSVL